MWYFWTRNIKRVTVKVKIFIHRSQGKHNISTLPKTSNFDVESHILNLFSVIRIAPQERQVLNRVFLDALASLDLKLSVSQSL